MSYNLPFKQGDTIVELGGGENPLNGREHFKVVNVDKRQLPTVDIVQDLEQPFGHIGKYDGLYASYLAEHISWRKIKQFFKSCSQVLKQGGVAVFIVPDSWEQMKKILAKGYLELSDSEFLLGSQDYLDNVHKVLFSKKFITKLLEEAGFEYVRIAPHPDTEARDMIVEAYKRELEYVDVPYSSPVPSESTFGKPKTYSEIQEVYDEEYFQGKDRGYLGYEDFPQHKLLAEYIKHAYNPKNVLEVGGAHGYITKHLNALGVDAVNMDVSNYAYENRVTNKFERRDATVVPYPYRDNEFDLVFSKDFLEHIEESKLDDMVHEWCRVGRQQFHIVTFVKEAYDIDDTHVTMRNREWWSGLFMKYQGDLDTVQLVGKDWYDDVGNYTVRGSKLTEGGRIDTRNVGGVTELVTKDSQNIRMLEYLRK